MARDYSKGPVLECGQSHSATPRGLFRDETPVPGFQHQYNRPEAHAEPMRDRFALDIGSENRAASTILLLEWV